MARRNENRSVASPAQLPAVSKAQGAEKRINVVIETPRGGRNKMSYDEQLGVFRLKKVLPEGMSFPYDFGFVPSTRAADGDPVDALVLMDEPGSMGCLVECRLIGVIRGEQREPRGWIRNDRLLAVAVASHTHADLMRPGDLNHTLVHDIERFFVNYNAERGRNFRVLTRQGPGAAWKLVRQAEQAFRK
jgi:inorganic pyrophosphatase